MATLRRIHARQRCTASSSLLVSVYVHVPRSQIPTANRKSLDRYMRCCSRYSQPSSPGRIEHVYAAPLCACVCACARSMTSEEVSQQQSSGSTKREPFFSFFFLFFSFFSHYFRLVHCRRNNMGLRFEFAKGGRASPERRPRPSSSSSSSPPSPPPPPPPPPSFFSRNRAKILPRIRSSRLNQSPSLRAL